MDTFVKPHPSDMKFFRRHNVILLVLLFLLVPAEIAQCAKPKKNVVGPPVRNSERTFQRCVRNYKELQRRNIVMQKRDYSCGAAALATVCYYYWGDNVDEEFFLALLDLLLTDEEIEDRIENGLAMTDLRKAAVKAGYQASIGKLSFEKLSNSKVPLIVGITVDDYDHFVVYRGTDGVHVYLADPIRGNLRIPTTIFVRQWQENAILAIAKPGRKIKEYSALSLRGEELFLGRINEQISRTAGSRIITRPIKK